jgi:hypothetical protein
MQVQHRPARKQNRHLLNTVCAGERLVPRCPCRAQTTEDRWDITLVDEDIEVAVGARRQRGVIEVVGEHRTFKNRPIDFRIAEQSGQAFKADPKAKSVDDTELLRSHSRAPTAA